MYYDKNDTDLKIIAEDGELFAHKFVNYILIKYKKNNNLIKQKI